MKEAEHRLGLKPSRRPSRGPGTRSGVGNPEPSGTIRSQKDRRSPILLGGPFLVLEGRVVRDRNLCTMGTQ
jgi:hypothetical protein